MKTVWVNGCFDVLHIGHVRLLKFAASLGDHLVVALNSDESVRVLKGDGRPVFHLSERMEVIKALRFVDEVISFGESTPVNAMWSYQIHREPIDVVVKGAEYANIDLPELNTGLHCQFHFFDSGVESRSSKLVTKKCGDR